MDESPRYWFPAKRYGWGWGIPCAWQGWLVLGTFIALVAACALFIQPARHPWTFAACIAILCVALVGICYAKGEPPRWRWGSE